MLGRPHPLERNVIVLLPRVFRLLVLKRAQGGDQSLAGAAGHDHIVDIAPAGRHEGVGKPEPLKGELSSWWFRRIDGRHRLVYRLAGSSEAQRVQVVQCRRHY